MKLSQLAAKPQLTKLEITDEAIVAEYGAGEPIEFYTWDRQPLNVFMALAANQGEDPAGMIDVVRKLILDEKGNEIVTKDNSLPSPVLMRAIAMIVERLGK
jgi:hypothetical protein